MGASPCKGAAKIEKKDWKKTFQELKFNRKIGKREGTNKVG
jgi:hypothetical protein